MLDISGTHIPLNEADIYELEKMLSIPINYISHSLCVAGERGYDDEEVLNLTNICEHLPRSLVVPREEGEEFIAVLKL